MKLKLALIAATGLAMAATSADAGGFRYKSNGGNWGNWAYFDAQAGGDAKAYGKSGKTETESYAEGHSYRKFRQTGAWSTSGNRSNFEVTYGFGSAWSTSSAVAGSGIGDGHGYKNGFLKSAGSYRGQRR